MEESADLSMEKHNRIEKHKENIQNIIGIDIKPEFPKKPNITVLNFFNRPKEKIADEIIKKIKKNII